jgi:putative ABC transport system permease protein
VVVTLARLGRRLPLTLRYAARDAARHRTRTVPAVAAVAATVAGVVALSIANTSDQAQAKASYSPELPSGLAGVTLNDRRPDWTATRAAILRVVPDAAPSNVRGLSSRQPVRVALTGHQGLQGGYASQFPSGILVNSGTGGPPALLRGLVSTAAWAKAAPVLAHGGALVLTSGPTRATSARLIVDGRHARSVRLTASVVDVGSVYAPVEAVVAPSAVHRLGLEIRTAGLLLTGPTLTGAQESTLRETLAGLDPSSYVYVERGYQTPGSERVVLWILFGLGAVLMLGGTLTATFLALSDARPDLATLSAVGASPRTRRGVAAAYAVTIGLVGAVLGAMVGFIPGIAISYPLTRSYIGQAGPSHYLSIPWLEIVGLVVLLPLLTAVVVGLMARSRLPLVARLD